MKRVASGWYLAGVAVLCGMSAFSDADDKPTVSVSEKGTVIVHVEPQPWQVRRQNVAGLVKRINDSQGKDEAAIAQFDTVLTGFEKDIVSITPMEAMDLMQFFYVPQDQGLHLDQTLTTVAALATLGWYDALRYADASGRAEIVNNERFFLKPFSADDGRGLKEMTAYLKRSPKEAAAAVQAGIQAARKLRGHAHYAEDWPSAYGLSVMQCGLAGNKNCPKPTPLPEAEWDKAFEEAAARVEHYYRINDKQ